MSSCTQLPQVCILMVTLPYVRTRNQQPGADNWHRTHLHNLSLFCAHYTSRKKSAISVLSEDVDEGSRLAPFAKNKLKKKTTYSQTRCKTTLQTSTSVHRWRLEISLTPIQMLHTDTIYIVTKFASFLFKGYILVRRPVLHYSFSCNSVPNLLTAITSRVATLISASSKEHVTIESHVMCLVFCMYSTVKFYVHNFIF